LDGLRGLAALSVMLLHYVLVFAPFLIGAFATQRHTHFDRLIATTPLQLPTAGDFAVCIFFVLSGFVLSLSFFKHRNVNVLISAAARRYFRLAIPAFGSIMLGYVALRLGLIFIHQAAVFSQATSFVGFFWNIPAHLGRAVFEGVYNIWFGRYSTAGSYNPVLWTMHFELFGSFLLFLFLGLFGNLRNRWLFYGVFGLVFLKTYFLCFILGIALCDLSLNTKVLSAVRPHYLWAALPVGLFLGNWVTSGIYPTIYLHMHLPFFSDAQLQPFAHVVGAAIVVLAVLRLQPLSRLLETRPFQYLGRVSFALYLTHFIVMSSLASFVFYKIYPLYGYRFALLATFAIAWPVTFGLASLFTRYVDVPAIALSKKIGNRLVSDQPLRFEWKSKRLRLPGKLNPLKPIVSSKPLPNSLADEN
jgi:peptidoglycan/LPS O-acetylase OafA/YrhL